MFDWEPVIDKMKVDDARLNLSGVTAGVFTGVMCVIIGVAGLIGG